MFKIQYGNSGAMADLDGLFDGPEAAKRAVESKPKKVAVFVRVIDGASLAEVWSAKIDNKGYFVWDDPGW